MRQLQSHELYDHYGGLGFIAFCIAILPFLVQSTASLVSSVKMIDSDNGSVKNGSYESHWSNNKEPAATVKESPAAKTFVYTY